VRSAAGLPTASMVGLVAGSASPASRPSGPCGAALRAGLDPSSTVTFSVFERTSRRLRGKIAHRSLRDSRRRALRTLPTPRPWPRAARPRRPVRRGPAGQRPSGGLAGDVDERVAGQ